MPTRQDLNDRINAYADAVRGRDADAVAALFAERVDHRVHCAGDNPDTPWNTKRETDREGIRAIYQDFFTQVQKMTVAYTDRVLDVEGNAAALIVRVKTPDTRMENALQLKWNADGEIILFYNWYGLAPD